MTSCGARSNKIIAFPDHVDKNLFRIGIHLEETPGNVDELKAFYLSLVRSLIVLRNNPTKTCIVEHEYIPGCCRASTLKPVL